MPDPNQIKTQLKTIMAEVFTLPAEQIDDSISFGDVEAWNSLSHMDLLMTLEDRYGLELDADTISELTSLEAILNSLLEMQHE